MSSQLAVSDHVCCHISMFSCSGCTGQASVCTLEAAAHKTIDAEYQRKLWWNNTGSNLRHANHQGGNTDYSLRRTMIDTEKVEGKRRKSRPAKALFPYGNYCTKLDMETTS